MWKDLTRTALVGAEKANLTPNTLRSLSDLGVDIETDEAELVLTAAAVVTQMRKAAFMPSEYTTPLPKPCPIDQKEPCPPKATRHLIAILEGRYPLCLSEFLQLCQAHQQRLPHEILPEILNKAVKDKTLFKMVQPTLGERGNWLIQQNPTWANVQNELSEHLYKIETTPYQKTIVQNHEEPSHHEKYLTEAKEIAQFKNTTSSPTGQSPHQRFQTLALACPIELFPNIFDIFSDINGYPFRQWAMETLEVIRFRKDMQQAFNGQ